MAGLKNLRIRIKIGTVEITDILEFSGIQESTNLIEVQEYNSKYTRTLLGSATVDPVKLTVCSAPKTNNMATHNYSRR